MEKNTIMWVVIGVLFLSVIFLTYKTSTLTGNTVNTITSSGKIDTSSWSENEKMNYDMHGIIPARFQGKVTPSASSGAGMVGGC